mgnify:CR=1 FL=1
MFSSKKYRVFILVMLVIAAAGCRSKKEGTVLARFDSATITKEEFVDKLRGLPRDIQSIAYRHKKDFVEEMVNERFLMAEAKKRHIDNLPDVKALLKAAHEKIIVSKLIEIEVDRKIKLEPDEASKYYESHKEEFMAPLLLRASHILMTTEEDANAVRTELDTGADFEALAKSRSTDNTATRGGDIGYFQKGQLIPEFEEQAYKLSKGQMSPVFKTQFGYHIIKLTDRIEPALKDFKIVKPRLEKQILNEKRSRTLKALVGKIKGNARVQIDEKILESISAPSPVK